MNNVETFPQSSPKSGKPSPIEILIGPGAGSERIALLQAAYPNMSEAEMTEAISEAQRHLKAHGDRMMHEADALDRLHEIAERGDPKRGEPLIDILQRLADAGDEEARAAVATLTTPERQEFHRVLEAAAEADPFWSLDDDKRTFRRHLGALHSPKRMFPSTVSESKSAEF